MKKFYLSLLGSALLSIVVLGWLIDAFSQQTHSPQDEFSLQSKLLMGFSQQLLQLPPAERSQYTQQLASQFELPLTYRATETLALPNSLLQQMNKTGGLILEDQQGFYLLYSNNQLAPFHLKLRLEKTIEQIQQNDMLLTLLFYAGLCVFMGFIIAPLAKRLGVVNEAAKQFASGNLQARIKVSYFTYIKDVELTFNRMASQIEKLLDENKLMASSLSHDIRTPIACLRFGLDATLDCDDEQKRLHYLTRMESDLDQMESMLKSYLAFATLEQKATQLNYAHTELNDYLKTVIAQLEPKIAKHNIDVELNCDDISVYADLHWLARAISNLLSNACDFASDHIVISAKKMTHTVVITVEDDGPGIEEHNWHKVFTPFFQEQNHRNREAQSYGLGLAIVAKVADWHHGSVTVSRSKQLKGACFTLKIHNTNKM
ncbi:MULTISPECIES: HAMP domain-containing sensor histidine kinase [unclassified Pseudoalteromonas]|uniref:sensor histidine kinase n=1 Tax=unclassified Pseudoalteromonas TaxID=194690 RepID=UPI000C08192F|nr:MULTISPECIES: HAMP domain-containing sensor histidine kinase [unclassified Pseudoalteromonas]MDP2636424.1 HAMP domain-containing sensor histidine kinase [Pseudoalteromonas sp. 1_MG-2023]PHN90871.1 two-component sensor histidine kinase [Pseudoalteromonas sp. 3D05]